MAVVKRNDAKDQIMDVLSEEGYPSYAKLLSLFDVFLTDDPDVVAYMIPGKAAIVLNQNLNIDQVSTLVRHEILHEYFTHAERQAEFQRKHPGIPADHELSNIAGDYDISNRGYTEKDKRIARAIQLNDQILTGLVTEDQHPDWVGLSFEEMYEKLLEERKKDMDDLKELLQELSKLTPQDLDDLQKQIDEARDQAEKTSGQPQQGGNSGKQPEGSRSGSGSGKPSGKQSEKTQQSSGNGSGQSDTEKKLDDLADAAEGAGKQLDDIERKSGDEPIDSAAEQKAKEQLAKRVQEIKDAFEDAKQQANIEGESAAAKRKEKAASEVRNIERVRRSGINQFKLNLNKFIANQVEEEEVDTYARENPAYADGEFILPGRISKEEKHIPIINVYWDVSGSFDDPAKTASARSAIGTLNQYVRNGDIEIHTYYFADKVSDTRSGAGMGTSGGPVALHIEQTKPDNVIIITDADTDQQYIPYTTVPGAVWMLFYDGRSDSMMKNIRGKKQNKYFDIEY